MMENQFNKITERIGTDCIKWDFAEMIFGEKNLLPMWVADMDFKAPQAVIDAIKTRADHGIFGYTGVSETLKSTLTSWLKKRLSWDVTTNSFIFTPGVVPALALILNAFTKEGDEVIVQPPVYYPFFSIVEKNRRTLLHNPLIQVDGDYKMDLEDLQKKITPKTKMIFLCSPHNPVGRVWKKEELLALGEICIKHNILIVSDEIHADIIFKNHKHYPIASLSPELEKITLTCMAPSKTFNTAGLGLSFVVIPNQELKKKLFDQLEAMALRGCNLFGLVAMEAAYAHGEKWLETLLSVVEKNAEVAMTYFKKELPLLQVQKPEGTFLLWLDCRKLPFSHQEMKERLLTIGKIALNDGPQFGQGGEGFFRLNLAAPERVLIEGLERIKISLKA